MNILIVDDNPRMRGAIKSLLTAPGVECIECENGIQALQKYKEMEPAWVLMDIMMPGINGFEATRRIVTENPDARVVIVTDYGDNEFKDAAEKAGAVAFILKEDLVKLRELCLNNKSKESI